MKCVRVREFLGMSCQDSFTTYFVVLSRDVLIIALTINNSLYRLIFSYRLSDQYVYQISSRSDIIGGQSQVHQ